LSRCGSDVRASGRASKRSRAAAPIALAGVALGAVAAIVGLTAGCEIIVPGTLSGVRCSEEGAVGPPLCPLGTFCHAGVCRAGPPSLGEPCDAEMPCAPGDVCVTPGSIGLSSDAFCSRTCCSSADCGVGTGLVCAALGPGKMCVPAPLWQRVAPGDRFAGEPCDLGSQCRSGQCSGATGHCVDTCCSDAECATFGSACREDGTGWTCEPMDGPGKGALEPCEHDTDCRSGLCAGWPDGKGRCAEPCCSSAECGKVKVGDVTKNILCTSVRHGSALVYACAAASEGDGNRAVGEPCETDGQCRGGRCIEPPPHGNGASGSGAGGGPAGGKVCSDACCTDASCGASSLFACAPVGGGAPLGSGGQGFDLQCIRR
jgi:hypothetical protein